MMPARRAAWIGSPFLLLPPLISFRAAADIAIEPRAIASRSVIALSPTSTMRMRPCGSTCVNREPGTGSREPLVFIIYPLGEIERQALERHGQVHALHLHAGGHLERS